MLSANRACKAMTAEKEEGGRAIGSFGPRGKRRETLPGLGEEMRPIDVVEGVLQVDLKYVALIDGRRRSDGC